MAAAGATQQAAEPVQADATKRSTVVSGLLVPDDGVCTAGLRQPFSSFLTHLAHLAHSTTATVLLSSVVTLGRGKGATLSRPRFQTMTFSDDEELQTC